MPLWVPWAATCVDVSNGLRPSLRFAALGPLLRGRSYGAAPVKRDRGPTGLGLR
jgi:hypothetical protein